MRPLRPRLAGHAPSPKVSVAAAASLGLVRFHDRLSGWIRARRIWAWKIRALIRAIVRTLDLVGLRYWSGQTAAIVDAGAEVPDRVRES